MAAFCDACKKIQSDINRKAIEERKKRGERIGKPKGTIQKSKFDMHQKKIIELLGYGLSAEKICVVIGMGTSVALRTYINKRKLNPRKRKRCNKKKPLSSSG